jgi:transcriptional regulator with XRE-family HTH domain
MRRHPPTPIPLAAELGEQLCELRRRAGLTQQALAALVGCSKRTISNFENAISFVRSLETLTQLADCLGHKVVMVPKGKVEK